MNGASIRSGLAPAAWVLAALVSASSVWLINGAPLFYYDTFGYFEQGEKMLAFVGLGGGVAVDVDGVASSAPADSEVVGSRSAVYAVIASLLAWVGGFGLVILGQLSLVILTTWLSIRATQRFATETVPRDGFVAVSFPVVCAALGSLPFFVMFLMPDIFTGILLISLSLLSVAWRLMNNWEVIAAFLLGLLGVTSHLSHIPIVAMFLPVAALAGIVLHGRMWWVSVAFVSVVLGFGLVERKAFDVAVDQIADAEVTYYPLITARLIEDGPGLQYLSAKCPDERVPTCALYEALSWSDDPYRMTASHILFEKSARLGSFQLMSAKDQKAVAADQYGFFFDVLKAAPIGVVRVMIENTMIQARMNSVDMTIPEPHLIKASEKKATSGQVVPKVGRLVPAGDWLSKVELGHSIFYALCFALALFLLVFPAKTPREVRMFVVALFLGILVNAFVCGAVSQPATRYGARAIWLLPYGVAFLLLFSGRALPFEVRSRSSGAKSHE